MDVYFDAQLTGVRDDGARRGNARRQARLHREAARRDLDGALELTRIARECGVKNGVVHDKLYLPGLLKLKRLIDGGFFGSILSVRGEFGYWVFEGDWQDAQRPSWNYRAEDGGGIVLDMFCHWNYVLENLFGSVESVIARAVTHIPQRWDEDRRPTTPTPTMRPTRSSSSRAASIAQLNSSWCVRVHRDELVEFQVDGTARKRGRRPAHCVIQHRANTPGRSGTPTCRPRTPFASSGSRSPTTRESTTGSSCSGSSSSGTSSRTHRIPYDFASGARGVRLAEAALLSSAEGRRVELVGSSRMTPSVRLPRADRTCSAYQLREPVAYPRAGRPDRLAASRSPPPTSSPTPFGENVPGAPATLDWDATLAFRRHLWSYGLGVAEAMDTAQRSMGLDWAATRELITRSAAEARARRRPDRRRRRAPTMLPAAPRASTR